jgi:hypothetical protein
MWGERERESGGESLFYLANLPDRLSHDRSSLTLTVELWRAVMHGSCMHAECGHCRMPTVLRQAQISCWQLWAVHRPELLSSNVPLSHDALFPHLKPLTGFWSVRAGSHVSHFLGRARIGIVYAVGKPQVY